MAVFGGFETIREHARDRSGLAVVYVAKAESGKGKATDCAVKVLESAPEIVGKEQAKRELDAFLQAGEVQQAAFKADSRYWAPVYESGMCEQGAYIGTDLYPLSVQRLIDGKTRLDGVAVLRLMRAVVGGLCALKKARSRSHGRLRASNVLIGGRGVKGGDPRKDQIVLVDPIADSELDEYRDEAADLRALGQMIHEMVLHVPFKGRATWPVETGAAWDRMGKVGQAIWALCNEILDPEPDGGGMTLEEVEQRLNRIKMPTQRRGVAVVAVVAVLMLAVAGVYFGMGGGGGGKGEPLPEVTDEEALVLWSPYLKDFKRWYGGLTTQIIKASREDKETAKGDEGLRALDERLTEYRSNKKLRASLLSAQDLGGVLIRYNKKEIQSQLREGEFDKLPPESVGMVADQAKLKNTLQLYKQVRKELVEWKTLSEARELVFAFEGRGWMAAGQWVDEPIGSIDDSLGEGDLEPASNLWKTLNELARRVGAAQPVGQSFEALVKRAQAMKEAGGSEYEILARLEDLGNGISSQAEGKASLDELGQAISAVGEVLTEVDAFLKAEAGHVYWKGYDKDWKLSEKVGGDERVTVALVRDWMGAAGDKKYRLLEPDPRGSGWDADAKLSSLNEQIAELKQLISEEEDSPDKAGLEQELAGFEAQVVKLGDVRERIGEFEPLERLRGEIEQEMGAFEADRGGLASRIDDSIGVLTITREELIEQLMPMRFVSPAMDQSWIAQRDAMIGLTEKDVDSRRLKRGSKKLVEFYTVLEENFSAELGESVAGSLIAEQAAGAVDAQREAGLGQVFLQTRFELTGPEVDAAVVDAAVKAYEGWLGRVASLGGELDRAVEMLDGAYAVDEAESETGETLRQIRSRWQDEALPGGVESAAKAVLGRVDVLERIDNEADWRVLLGDAGSGEIGRAVAGVMRLIAVGAPSGAGAIDEEADAFDKARGVVEQGIGDEARRGVVLKRLGAEAKRLWQRRMVQATDALTIDRGFEVMDRFGVSKADLTGAFGVNYAMYELRALGSVGVLEDDAVSRPVQAFLNVARSLGVGGDEGSFEEMLRELEEQIIQDEAPKVDVTTIGPGGVGWVGRELDVDGQRVAFSWTGASGRNHEVVFDLVTPVLPAEPVFMSEEEVSIGLFSDLAQAAGSEVLGVFEGMKLKGLVSWERRGAQFVARAHWLDGAAQIDGSRPIYPQGILEGGSTSGLDIAAGQGEPGVDHPMTQVPISAAFRAAQVAGCRFATVAEWNAAVDGAGGMGQLERFNLRDQTWGRQRDYIARRADSSGADTLSQARAYWPDAGAYRDKSRPPSGAKAELRNFDDGKLWFSRVDEGGGGGQIKHLIGNVAEFVLLDATVFDEEGAVVGSSWGEVKSQLEQAGVGVIGGSALSAPSMAINEASWKSWGRKEAGPEHSDVGFRLAFSAKGVGQPMYKRLAKILEGRSYLPVTEPDGL